MPWLETEFRARVGPDGRFQGETEAEAPAGGKLREYKVKTTSGCGGRVHPTVLIIQREDNLGDKLELHTDLRDCEEHQADIDPPFQIRGGRRYIIRLTSEGFDPDEEIEGEAAVRYTFFLDANASFREIKS